MAGNRITGSLALTVHGPSGSVDLVVPPDVLAADIAREYAAQRGLAHVPPLLTRLGEPLAPDDVLAARGLVSGDLLVVGGETVRARRPHRPGSAGSTGTPGPVSALWVALAAALAVAAGWLAARTDGTGHDATVMVLAAAALTGLVPTGVLGPHRATVAPFFAGAAAYAVAYDPAPERLPTVVGVAALVAAVTAGLARAVDRRADEALRVWIVAGSAVFVVTCACALLGLTPQVAWALLLVGAVLAARLVPGYAVDVPDSYLVDLERLAVSAWSARTGPGRRSRSMVPVGAVAEVAARGARTLAAAACAVLLVVALAAPLLLQTADLAVDRVGARLVVGLGGVSLLFAARSYRYAWPRGLLRAAGLWCLLGDLAVVLPGTRGGAAVALVAATVAVALGVLAAAVATGRGWRSAWWSARAELAEALATAGTLGTLVVASGLFRAVWESHFGV